MTEAVGSKGDISGTDRAVSPIVVIHALTGNNIIGFAFVVMLVVADLHPGSKVISA